MTFKEKDVKVLRRASDKSIKSFDTKVLMRTCHVAEHAAMIKQIMYLFG